MRGSQGTGLALEALLGGGDAGAAGVGALVAAGQHRILEGSALFNRNQMDGACRQARHRLARSHRELAHTLLKIAYQVLKTGTAYQEPGADFYTRRESPAARQAFLQRQLQKLHPGCTITITISPPEAALTPGA